MLCSTHHSHTNLLCPFLKYLAHLNDGVDKEQLRFQLDINNDACGLAEKVGISKALCKRVMPDVCACHQCKQRHASVSLLARSELKKGKRKEKKKTIGYRIISLFMP